MEKEDLGLINKARSMILVSNSYMGQVSHCRMLLQRLGRCDEADRAVLWYEHDSQQFITWIDSILSTGEWPQVMNYPPITPQLISEATEKWVAYNYKLWQEIQGSSNYTKLERVRII